MSSIRYLFAACFVSLTVNLYAQAPAGHAPGMLGVALDEVESPQVESLGLPGIYGAWVRDVGPSSPAEKAGIQADDVIVGYNGVRVESAMALRRLVHETPAGRTVEIRLIRDGSPHLTQPVLGKGTVTASTAAPRPTRSLGVWIEAVAPAVAQYLELEEGVGMIVRDLQAGSAADRAGLQKKDILISVNDQPVTTAETVAQQINQTPGNQVPFQVIRAGEKIDITVGF